MSFLTSRYRLVLAGSLACLIAVGCSKPKKHAKPSDVTAEASATSEASTSAPVPSASAAAADLLSHPALPADQLKPPPLHPPADALVGPGGVRYQIVRAGSGDNPGPGDAITGDVSMWTGAGTLAQSTFTSEHSTTFSATTIGAPVRSLLTQLKPGARATFWVPREAMVGWRPSDWPDTDLVIDFELRGFMPNTVQNIGAPGGSPGAAPPGASTAAPPDAAGPPATANKTPSGLSYTFLAHGSGKQHVAAGARIALKLDGFAVEGLTVNRIAHGQAVATTLERAPGNLAEVLQQLVPGDTVRVWFPKKMGAQVLPDAGERELVIDMVVAVDG